MTSSGSKKKPRIISLSVRVTEAEKDRLTDLARAKGLTPSAFLRKQALGVSEKTVIRPRPKPRIAADYGQHIALILACLAQIKEAVDEANNKAGDDQTDLIGTVAIARALLQARDHCFDALGRKP